MVLGKEPPPIPWPDIGRALSNVIDSEAEAHRILRRISFPENRLPRWDYSLGFWTATLRLIEVGLLDRKSVVDLIQEALIEFPGNVSLRGLLPRLQEAADPDLYPVEGGHLPWRQDVRKETDPGFPTPSRTPARAPVVLFVGSNPPGSVHLDLAQERRDIGDALRGALSRVDVQDAWAPGPGTIFNDVMRANPSVLHFGGHCDEHGCLHLHGGKDGSAFALSPQQLRDHLTVLAQDKNTQLKFVLLNACYSSAASEFIRDAGYVSIGWPNETRDSWVLFVTTKFYECLAAGRSLRAAIDMTNKTIAHRNRDASPQSSAAAMDRLIVDTPDGVSLDSIVLVSS